MDNNFKNFWDKKWSKVTKNIGPTQFGLSIQEYLEPNKKILDIGSGVGRDTYMFAELGLEVDALDFSKNALNNISGKNIQTICASSIEYEYPINNYDYIYACNSLHYFSLSDFQKVVTKLYDALKQGGLLFIRVKSIHDIKFGKGEKVEENYYKDGEDKKYYFSKSILSEACKQFETLSIKEIEDQHDNISGGTVTNGFIDIVVKK